MTGQRVEDDNAKLAMNATAGPQYPPLWVWGVSGLLLVTAVILRFDVMERGDLANVFTALCGLGTVMLPVLWLAFRSHLSLAARIAPLIAVVGAIATFFLFNKIASVDGDLNPVFQSRWAPSADETLSKQNEIADALDAESPDFTIRSAGDFPQFLGATRRCEANHVQLVSDWNAAHPKQVWKHEIGAGWAGCSAVNGFLVTMEQRGVEEWVSCYRVSDGKPIWVNSIETRPRHETILGGIGPRSTPTIDGNRVYVVGTTGIVRCIDGASGESIWVENLLQRFSIDRDDFDAAVAWGRSASPLIVGNKMIVPVGGPSENAYKTLAAFDKMTGELIWTGGSSQISYSSPIVAFLGGKQQIVYVGESQVTGHDIDTGEVLWNYDWPGSSNTDANTSQPILTPEGHLFVSKGYGAGAALLEVLEAQDGQWTINELWVSSRVMKTKFTNVAMHNGYVFGLSDAVLECIELSSGKRRWKRGRYGHGQILRVNDLLLVQAEEGEVVLVEANGNKHVELGKFDALEGKTWNNLCLYKDQLIVRNAAEIACYQLATKADQNGGKVIGVEGGNDGDDEPTDEATDAEEGAAETDGAGSGEPANSNPSEAAQNDDSVSS